MLSAPFRRDFDPISMGFGVEVQFVWQDKTPAIRLAAVRGLSKLPGAVRRATRLKPCENGMRRPWKAKTLRC